MRNRQLMRNRLVPQGRPGAAFLRTAGGAAAAALSFSLGVPTAMAQNAPDTEPETVASVDLERYMGLWYEYAKLPNRFQSQCRRNTTAEYSLRDDGRVTVVNRCETEDGVDEIEGVARVADETTNAKLEVSFVSILGFSLFWADYWVLGLGDAYDWAVVGSPDRDFGWLLVRDPDVSEEVRDEMYFTLESKGYRHTDFELTPHDAGRAP